MSTEQDLVLGLVYALLLILGLIQCGRLVVLILKTCLGLRLEYSCQQLVLGTAVVSIALSWGSLLILTPLFYRYSACALMSMGVLGGGIWMCQAVRLRHCLRRKQDGWLAGCMWVLIILYLLANIGLVSNADSLDYHLGYSLNYLRVPFESQPEWYTGRMAQAGEKVVALGLAFRSQAFASLIQYAGLVALAMLIINMPRVKCKADLSDVHNYQGLLSLAWVSSPVLLFLATSAKPQLMPTAMSGLGFVLVVRTLFEDTSKENRPNSKLVLTTLLIAFSLVSVAATHKSSFLISLAILGCLSAYTAYRLQLLRRFLMWAALIGLIIFLPVYWDKFLRYQSTPYAFLASPVGGFNESLRLFLIWVKRYRENPLPFPFYLVLPSSPGNITTVMGFGALLVGYGLSKWACLQRTQLPIRVLLFFLAGFVAILWLVGQPSTRFYLEPYVWALLLLAMLGLNCSSSWLLMVAKVFLVGQTILVIGALSFYVLGVLNSFVPGGQDAFLKKYVNGYDLHQWIDRELPAEAAILLDHRSKALARREAISSDPIEFGGGDWVALQELADALNKHQVKFAVTRDESPIYSLLASCSEKTFAGPETMHLASRNPFNAGGTYQAYIFSIEPDQLIHCIAQKKNSL